MKLILTILLFCCISLPLFSQVMTYRDPCIYSQGIAGTNVSGSGLIPPMTTDTTPSGIASAISEGAAQAYLAFDATTGGTVWQFIYHSGDLPWIQYQFPGTHIVTRYEVIISGLNSGDNPATAWNLQGSNNGTVWTTLDSESGQNPNNTTTLSFTISNSTAYSYYRLNLTAFNSNTTSIVAVGMLQLYGT